MSTRSIIAKENRDGSFTGIYAHFDGYPEHNGQILVNHYINENKIDQLLKLGDISSLGPEIGEKHSFEDRDHKDWCTAYKRDRGEKGTNASHYKNLDEVFNVDRGQDYVYIWRRGNGITGSWNGYTYNQKSVDLAKFKS